MAVQELRRRTEPPTAVIRAAIVYKALGSIILCLTTGVLLGFLADTPFEERLREVLIATALNSNSVLVERLLIRLGMLSDTVAVQLALVALLYGVLEAAESIGLATRRRWAEYLTFLATALLLPPELREVLIRFSVANLLLFVVNAALAVYLVAAKRLFRVSVPVQGHEQAGLLPEMP